MIVGLSWVKVVARIEGTQSIDFPSVFDDVGRCDQPLSQIRASQAPTRRRDVDRQAPIAASPTGQMTGRRLTFRDSWPGLSSVERSGSIAAARPICDSGRQAAARSAFVDPLA
jgi:hypothetical protein